MSEYFNENKLEAGHGRKSLHGGLASLVARAINAIIQIGSVLFLARLLAPEDYGLVAMVTAITGFATVLVDLGTRDAVVQRPSITQGEVSALFWITMAVGGLLAVVVAACAPVFAWFYGEPRLTMIAAASAVTFITSALTCQHYALLRRAMKFRQLGIIEVGANLVGASVAVGIAFYGLHYWALVLRPIVSTALIAVGVWVQCRWLPSKPTMTSGVKGMVKFGLNITGFTLTDYGVGRSTDKVVIGYGRGARELGYYQNAMFIYDNLLDALLAPLHAVGVSSLSKVRADIKEYRRLWGRALSTVAFYVMPAFGILAVTSADLIVLMLGTKWSKAGVLLSVLALRGIPHCVERTLGWLHVSAGRSDRWMRYGVVSGCAHLAALFFGLRFGALGVVTAYVICMYILFIPAIVYAGRPMNIGTKDVIAVVWRQLAGALPAVAVGFLLRYTLLANASGMARMAVLVAVYLTQYSVTVVGLFRLRMPVGVVLQLARDFLPKRFARLLRTPQFIDRYSYEHI